MITKNNFLEVLNSLEQSDIQNAIESDTDLISIELNIFNTGFIAFILPFTGNDDEKNDLLDNGNLVIDKNEFFQLANESNFDVSFLD